MADNNNIFGNWGSFVFTGRISPLYGTFAESRKWNYARHVVLSGIDSLEPVGRDLITISFSLSVKNFVFTQLQQGIGQQIISGAGVGTFGQVSTFEGMFDKIDEILFNLYRLAEQQAPNPFYEGDEYKGMFVLTDIREQKLHYKDGFKKVDSLDLTFLEWVK